MLRSLVLVSLCAVSTSLVACGGSHSVDVPATADAGVDAAQVEVVKDKDAALPDATSSQQDASTGGSSAPDSGTPELTPDSGVPTGPCAGASDGDACDDGDACTADDACLAGSCVGGSALSCDDSNDCTTDACDSDTGCTNTSTTDACDDGDACSSADQCSNGSCAGATLSCDDANVCTDDSCDSASGCVNTNNTANCDDNNACTVGDACSGGGCQPGTALSCDDGNPCTDDSCDPTSGCVHTNNAETCEDGNACTVGDVCGGGQCQPGAAPNCDDGNGCTDDLCDSAVGCVNLNNTASCDDGDACTVSDVCNGGQCQPGAAPNCDDGNVCTDDLCDSTSGCVNPVNTIGCDDGNANTVDDVCAAGVCAGVDLCAGVTCAASDQCHVAGVCNPLTGQCSNPAAQDGLACNDGDACTVSDVCNGGLCQPGAAPNCDDGSFCTADSCDSSSGCLHTPTNIGLSCADDNLCDTGFTCQNDGSCVSTTTKDCTAYDSACNLGACDGSTGNCYASPAFDGQSCNDGNVCTTSDVCSSGTCGGATLNCNDGNPCTADSCDASSGCVNDGTGVTASCAPNSGCDTNFKCQGDAVGTCAPTGTKDCSNLNGTCAAGSCDDNSGNCVAVATNNGGACNDSNACTTSDVCGGGSCSGATLNCNDNNVCTDDGCNSGSGCTYTNNAASCNDGNPCTVVDKCSGGGCGGSGDPCGDYGTCTANGNSYSCTCDAGFTEVNGACVCDLNGTFAVQIDTVFSWSGIQYIESSNDATHTTPVHAYSWALRTHSYDANGNLTVETEPCGGVAPDLCGTGNILIGAEAYAQYQPNSVWQGTKTPIYTEQMTITNPQPGGAFDTPMVAMLLGISLTDPKGTWPSSRSAVGTGSPGTTNGAMWFDHDNDTATAFTNYVVPPGGIAGAAPIDYPARSPACPRLSNATRLPYAYLPGKEELTVTVYRVKRVRLASRLITSFSGEFDANTCDTITGSLVGPAGYPYFRSDTRVEGCVRVNGSGESECSSTLVNGLDQPSATQTVESATFTMKRINGNTCADVWNTFL